MTETITTKLPKGWASAQFKEITDNIPLTGKKLKQSSYEEKGALPVIDQGQEFIGGYTNNTELRITVKTPVIVFGDHTKVIKYVPFDFVPGADGIKVINPSKAISPKLLYYFMQATKLPQRGYARHFQFLEKSIIPIPPFQEQHKIASKVEELFSFLDAGVASLRAVQAQLKCYRQAVLKYAFEGKLTDEWRKHHQKEIEPVQKLIERLVQPKQRLPPLDTSKLLELPDSWTWVRLGEIADSVQYGTSDKAGTDRNGVPVLRMGNIQEGKLDFEKLKYLPKETPHLSDFILDDGDVLFNRTNSAELVGKTAVYKGNHPKSAFASYLSELDCIRTHMTQTYWRIT